MDILLWSIIILLFVLSFVGLIFPIIPSIVVIWGGFFVYHFFIDKEELTFLFWSAMVLFTVLIIGADIIANSYFVKKYGGSKSGERIAAIATIVGSFIFPPFGILVVPLAAVFVTEYIQHHDAKKAVKIGYATFIGFLSSTIAKGLIQIIMIVWFILQVFL